MWKNTGKIMWGSTILYGIVLIGIVLYLLLGEIFSDASPFYDSMEIREYPGTWTYVSTDGARQKVTIPHNFKLPKGETLIMETILPTTLTTGYNLCIRSNRQDILIYIDNILVESYSTRNLSHKNSSSQSAFLFLEIRPEYLGKTLRIESTTLSSYSGMFSTVLYGNKANIWDYYIESSLPELSIAFLAMVLGLGCTIVGLYFNHVYHYQTALSHIGCGAFLASLWVFTNTNIRQLIFPNITIAGDIPFYVIMLIPIPVLLYMNFIQSNRYQELYLPLVLLTFIQFFSYTILHAAGIAELARTISLVACYLFFIIVASIVTIIVDAWNKRLQDYWLSALGIVFVFFAGSFQMILYLLHVFSFNGLMVCMALLVIMITTIFGVVRGIRKMDNEREEAIIASKAKALFLARMSHEIRTPINAVLGMDEMILRESKDETIQDYATDIQRAGQTLLALINDILDYSKIESNKMEIIPVDYTLSSLIEDCYNMVSLRCQSKGLEFIVEGGSNMPVTLHGDEIRIRQIVLNLLTNAIKYTAKGKVTLSISGKKSKSDLYMLTIRVSDTGIGIRKEDQYNLFDSFSRVDDNVTHYIEGTGLGLAIVKQLVDLMQGTISVDSTLQKGSTFTIRIPQAVVGNDVMEEFVFHPDTHKQSGSTYSVSYTAPNARILVIDDVDMNLKVFTGLLKPIKPRIETASSGKQGLELIWKNKYDIIFLDHMMPGMDGIETFQEIRKKKNHPNTNTPIVMLTANALAGAKEEYLNLGFVDYLSKPIQQDALDHILLEHLPKQFIVKSSGSRKNISTNHISSSSQSTGNMKNISSSTMATLSQFMDVPATLTYCGENMSLFSEMLQSFVQDADFIAIEKAYESQTWDRYQTYVHGIKSSAAYLHIMDLSHQAKALELATKEERYDYLEAHHQEMMDLYRDYTNRISTVL